MKNIENESTHLSYVNEFMNNCLHKYDVATKKEGLQRNSKFNHELRLKMTTGISSIVTGLSLCFYSGVVGPMNSFMAMGIMTGCSLIGGLSSNFIIEKISEIKNNNKQQEKELTDLEFELDAIEKRIELTEFINANNLSCDLKIKDIDEEKLKGFGAGKRSAEIINNLKKELDGLYKDYDKLNGLALKYDSNRFKKLFTSRLGSSALFALLTFAGSGIGLLNNSLLDFLIVGTLSMVGTLLIDCISINRYFNNDHQKLKELGYDPGNLPYLEDLEYSLDCTKKEIISKENNRIIHEISCDMGLTNINDVLDNLTRVANDKNIKPIEYEEIENKLVEIKNKLNIIPSNDFNRSFIKQAYIQMDDIYAALNNNDALKGYKTRSTYNEQLCTMEIKVLKKVIDNGK